MLRFSYYEFKYNRCLVCCCLVSICPFLKGQFFHLDRNINRKTDHWSPCLCLRDLRPHGGRIVWKYSAFGLALCALQPCDYQTVHITSFPLSSLCDIFKKKNLYNIALWVFCSHNIKVFMFFQRFLSSKRIPGFSTTNKICLTNKLNITQSERIQLGGVNKPMGVPAGR